MTVHGSTGQATTERQPDDRQQQAEGRQQQAEGQRQQEQQPTAKAGPQANADFVAQMVASLEAEIEREMASNPTIARLLAAREKLKEIA